MCLTLVHLDPGSAWPVVLLSARDEFLDRAWDPPAAWWPGYPGVIGGRDHQAGGTWLAASPEHGRVAAVHTLIRQKPLPGAPSRGELPLRAVTGTLGEDVTGYDDYALLVADRGGVTWYRKEGDAFEQRRLDEGLHACSRAGCDLTDSQPRHAHWLAALTGVARPEPMEDTETDECWRSWLRAVAAHELPPDDPRALALYREMGERRYGTSSLWLAAVGRDGTVRMDFTDAPRDWTWRRVV